jgi:hypothetical protein
MVAYSPQTCILKINFLLLFLNQSLRRNPLSGRIFEKSNLMQKTPDNAVVFSHQLHLLALFVSLILRYRLKQLVLGKGFS